MIFVILTEEKGIDSLHHRLDDAVSRAISLCEPFEIEGYEPGHHGMKLYGVPIDMPPNGDYANVDIEWHWL